jgi:phospholipid transport system substrate-binding protein
MLHRPLRLAALALCASLVLIAGPATAGEPTDQLKPEIDRFVKVLEDPALKGESKTAARRQALRAITDTVFDWQEMSRRALGAHWQGRSEAERTEFVGLFRDLIEHAYASKIESYTGERVNFSSDSVEGDQATVRTRLTTTKGQEVPVDYRMQRRDGRWRIYDIGVEGVSMVGNYRTQFNQIIRASSYEELVRKLKSRSS